MKKRDLEAEFALWLKAYEMPEPIQQYKFHPKRKWRFDFAYPPVMIDIDGEYDHARWGQITKDAEKRNAANLMGLTVLVFTGKMMTDPEACVNIIREALSVSHFHDGAGAAPANGSCTVHGTLSE